MAAARFVSPGRDSVSQRTAPDIRFSDAVPDRRNPPNQGDINNDGNVDMVLLNVGKPPSLLLNHNESPIIASCSNWWGRRVMKRRSVRELR